MLFNGFAIWKMWSNLYLVASTIKVTENISTKFNLKDIPLITEHISFTRIDKTQLISLKHFILTKIWSVDFDKNSACILQLLFKRTIIVIKVTYGLRQGNLVLIAYASSEGSGEPGHPRSLARTFAARSYKQWIKRNLQTESQIPGPSEWLGMRSWNLSWRNARRHKFAWRGLFLNTQIQHFYDSWQY